MQVTVHTETLDSLHAEVQAFEAEYGVPPSTPTASRVASPSVKAVSMLSFLIRLGLAAVITSKDRERLARWIVHTTAGQALTAAHALGYRQGHHAGVTDAIDRLR